MRKSSNHSTQGDDPTDRKRRGLVTEESDVGFEAELVGLVKDVKRLHEHRNVEPFVCAERDGGKQKGYQIQSMKGEGHDRHVKQSCTLARRTSNGDGQRHVVVLVAATKLCKRNRLRVEGVAESA